MLDSTTLHYIFFSVIPHLTINLVNGDKLHLIAKRLAIFSTEL